jgi:HAE1 family hydrophobic/amphiphilic exporter-1
LRSIVAWCLQNRPVIVLFGLIMMAAGTFSIFQLNQELLPDISFPAMFVLVAEPGASPDQVDRDLALPIQNALTGIPHETHVTTSASQGFATVIVQFDLNSQLKDDQDAVQQRLAQVQLPPDAGRPLLQTFSFTQLPTITYSLAAKDGDLQRATTEANEVIAPALRSVAGVGQVKVAGGAADSVTITLEPLKMAAAGVSATQVQQALAASQVDLPAGEVLSGSKTLPVEVRSSLKTVGDLKALVVGAAATGMAAPRLVTLGDVATVIESPLPLNGISRTDGSPSLSISVIKTSDGNAVKVSRDVRAKMASLHLNASDSVSVTSDAAVDINGSISGLVEEGLVGAVLAILIIFLFLGSVRATLVTAISLPTSVLVALAGTQLFGYSLNIMTLAGLTIAIGRIVDDAIVVLENSYRHLQLGESPREAALNGAGEVSKAVLSTTLTTVAVFLPIGLVGGIISKFFLPFSVTVTIALLASLVVALSVVPVLVSYFLEYRGKSHGESRLVRAYRPLLAWSLSRGWRKAVVLVVAVLILGLSLLSVTRIPVNFFSAGGSDTITGQVSLPAGTTASETSDQLKPFETAAGADPNVKLVSDNISSTDFGSFTGPSSTNVARLTFLVKDKTQVNATRDRLQRMLDQLYGPGNGQVSVQSFGPPASSFTVTLSGSDPAALQQGTQSVIAALQPDQDLTNLRSSVAADKPQLLVTVDPTKAAAHGISPRQVAFLVASVLTPQQLGTLGNGGPVVTLRIDPAGLTGDSLGVVPVAPGVSLTDVATVSDELAAVSVLRQDGVQQATVTADFTIQDTNGASSRATSQYLKGLKLPAGVSLSTGGASQDIANSFGSMFQAIGVGVALVFIILVAFFRSVVTPFVILLTMPLALIGACLSLFITQQPLGLPALLGILMLFGIVVSNAILFVDFVERWAPGRTVIEALMLAGSARLRPILMTAVATVVALLPISIGLSGGGGGLISQSLAIVVEGGLISSTALTLLVIPIVYSIFNRNRDRRRPVAVAPAPVPAPQALEPAAGTGS